MAEPKIALAQVLREVRHAIRQASAEAEAEFEADKTKPPVMRFKGCEVEFALDVEVKGDGGIELWVLKLGGGRTKTESNTIKISYDAHGEAMVAPVHDADPRLRDARRQDTDKPEGQ